MSIESFRDLRVWQLGIELVEQVYKLTREFPKIEQYGLTSQLQRAAVSVPANIAEGHQRDSTKGFLYHLSVAIGSLGEAETHLVIAERLEYCTKPQSNELQLKMIELGRMLRALQRSLKSRLKKNQP